MKFADIYGSASPVVGNEAVPGAVESQPLDGRQDGINQRPSIQCQTAAGEPHASVDQLFRALEDLAAKHQVERSQCLEVWLRRQSSVFGLQGSDISGQHCTSSPTAVIGRTSSKQPHKFMEPVMSSSLVSHLVRGTSPGCPQGPTKEHTADDVLTNTSRDLRKAQSTNILHYNKPGKKKKKKKRTHLILSTPSGGTLKKNRLQVFTTSRVYEIGSALLIALNAVSIGWQVQWSSEHARDNAINHTKLKTTSAFFDALSSFFTLAFMVELALRWVADGFFEFFQTDEFGWCIFDVGIVSIGLLEMVFSLIADDSMPLASEITLLRVLRVMRVVKVLRVIRVMRFFRVLRMMIWSIMGSLKSLMWVMLVLALLFFVFGILVTQGVESFLSDNDFWLDPDHKDLIDSFATLDQSVVSLFMAMSGGNDWSLYYKALLPLPLQYRTLFLVFVAFSLFAVVNIVTGVFVQSALESSNQDREIVVHEELESKKQYCEAMREFFEEIDEDGSGTIGYAEFTGKLDDERVLAYFNALKLDVSDADMLFKLMDFDQSGEIGIDEFLVGCYKLQGESRTLDMKVMQLEVRWLHESLVKFMEEIRESPAPESATDLQTATILQ